MARSSTLPIRTTHSLHLEGSSQTHPVEPTPGTAAEETGLEKAFYKRILDSLPAQLAVLSLDGRYEYVTPGAIRDPELRRWLVGRTEEEYAALRGFSPEVAERRQEAISAARDGTPSTFEETFVTRRGDTRSFRRYVTPVTDVNGNVQHVLGYGIDITEQRRAEEQLRQAQKMEAVGRLAGGVAHDFNNLITIISGFADVLHQSFAPDDPRVEAVHSIIEASERAAGLTRQLLSFSRRAPLEVCTIDANDSVRATVHLLERIIGERVQVTVELNSRHSWVRADAGQFKQVILNLVLNARDAMPHGGSLHVSTRRVHFDHAASTPWESDDGHFLEVTVSDTGVGMSSETLARLFEPFFTTKGPDKGTGLGLSTVYGIVTQLGGYVMAESALGKGTTFRVLLPVAAAPVDADYHEADEISLPHEGGTVLIAEDEDAVRLLVSRILREKGYDVLLASCGSEAMHVIESHDGDIDLLLTDVVMPDFGGRTLAEAARLVRPGLRVLYMSGYADEDQLVGNANSADAFIDKPFTMDGLQTAVQAMLARTVTA